MKININDLVSHTNCCRFCIVKNRDVVECSKCVATKDYYCKPSKFSPRDELSRDYFTLLEEYTKLLYRLGFDFDL